MQTPLKRDKLRRGNLSVTKISTTDVITMVTSLFHEFRLINFLVVNLPIKYANGKPFVGVKKRIFVSGYEE